jgi:hypothetical protein
MMGMIEVIDSDDILITQVHPFKGGNDWYSLKESYKGTNVGISPSLKLAVYKRGNAIIDEPHKGNKVK